MPRMAGHRDGEGEDDDREAGKRKRGKRTKKMRRRGGRGKESPTPPGGLRRTRSY